MGALCLHPERPEALVLDGPHITRWDLAGRPHLVSVKTPEELRRAYDLAVAPDGSLLIAVPPPYRGAPPAGAIVLRRWEDLAVARQIHVGDGGRGLLRAAFSTDGRYLAGADGDERILIIHLLAGPSNILEIDYMGVGGITFSPDCRLLASFSTDQGGGYIGIWPITEGRPGACTVLSLDGLPDMRGLADTAGELAFSPDGRFLAALLYRALHPSWLVLFEVALARPYWAVPVPWADGVQTRQMLFTPDGAGIVYCSPCEGVVVRGTQDGQLVCALAPAPDPRASYFLALDPLRRGIWMLDRLRRPTLLAVEGFGFGRAGIWGRKHGQRVVEWLQY